MVSKQVVLFQLKVLDLKNKLEERELETTGKKSDLQNRLKQALINNGDDPENFLFDVESISALSKNVSDLKDEVNKNASDLRDEVNKNVLTINKNVSEIMDKFWRNRMEDLNK